MQKPQQQLPLPVEGESQVDLFDKQQVRKTFHQNEWWFSVKDVLEVLTDTTEGNRYSRDLRAKDEGLKARWAEITRTLPFVSGGGKQETTFINIEGLFRLLQSLPTKKAEPFKKWLAKVGFERVQEIQNPELAIQRAITLYRVKGYDDSWIEARITNKLSREQLEAEWEKRGIEARVHFAVLTDAISVETFGVSTQTHKNIKNLGKSHSLRDNMTPIELTLTTLGEQATKEIARTRNAQGFNQNQAAAKSGGQIAGNARREIEVQTQKSVVSNQNYLTERQKQNTQIPERLGQTIKRLLGNG